MRPGISKAIIIGAVIAVVAFNVALVLAMRKPAESVAVRTGTNMYPALLDAARQLQHVPGDASKLPGRTELEEVLRTNRHALLAAKAALAGDCWVPFSSADRADDFARFKMLARTLQCEAVLASMDSRHADAADAALRIAQLGHAVARDGVLIDALVGVGIERLAFTTLPEPAKLDAKTCSRLVAVLVELEQSRPSANEVWEKEVDWANRVHGFKGRVARLVTFKSLENTRKAWFRKNEDAQRQALLTVAALAARAYELEHGKPPTTWADLVPAHLKDIPAIRAAVGSEAKPIEFHLAR